MSDKCKTNRDDECTGTSGPEFDFPNGNGNTDPPGCDSGLGTNPCPVLTPNECSDFSLDELGDDCFIEGVIDEVIGIASATLNIHKLLGVHEQSRLVDCTGHGNPISGGELPGFPASNAYDIFDTVWRSIQRGPGVIASSYIGYDFGEIPVNDFSRNAYGVETFVMKHITAIAIKQSDNPNQRVTEARIERSNDGHKWYGVSRVILPDDECLNTILFSESVPARYWRIRPTNFSGGNNDRWVVKAIQMYHEYAATQVNNIQDKVFLENRDRDYDAEGLEIKGYYDLVDTATEMGKFGIELASQMIYINVSFARCVATLNRPLIIGDIIEIPSQAMYSSELRRIEKWMEVIDVAWSTEGFTPGWKPTLLRVIVVPAFASQETQDIFGDMATNFLDDLGTVDQETGQDPKFQDYFDAGQTMLAEARDAVPEKGAEASSTIRQWETGELEIAAADVFDENGVLVQRGISHLNSIGLNPKGVYVEDAMPPNNAEYTQADAFPSSPTHGDYHRLTYDSVSTEVAPRLYRYSETKGRWVYLETDRRKQHNRVQPMMQEFTTDPRGHAGDEIIRDDPRWRDKLNKTCSNVQQNTTKNTNPTEVKDGLDTFEVHSKYRSDNKMKPASTVDPTEDNPDPCPEDE